VEAPVPELAGDLHHYRELLLEAVRVHPRPHESEVLPQGGLGMFAIVAIECFVSYPWVP
jgi:hypothetical protein